MIVLYEHPLSPYAQKLKIALREKDVPFETRLPGGIGTGQTEGEFATYSPRGEVPLFIHDETPIFDSTIILEYIEEVWPTPALLPSDAKTRAKVRMIEEVMDTHVEAITWGLGELFFFDRATENLRLQMLTTAQAQSKDYFSWLEAQLGSNAWFNGQGFGWGDLAVIPYLNGLAGFDITPANGSRLADWFERVNDRKSVLETEKESRASIEGMSGVGDAIKAGLFKRQYRDHRLEWMIKTGGMDIVLEGIRADNIRFTDTFKA